MDRKPPPDDLRLGDALVEKIRRGEDVNQTANELLREFFRGYPVAYLKPLLASSQEDTVKAAAWIASELGEAAAPLLGDIGSLLHHQLPYVRFFALDAVLVLAPPQRGDLIAAAVQLIDDLDEGVRWKTMQFLMRATAPQLRASLRHFRDFAMAAHVKWLLKVVDTVNIHEVNSGLDLGGRPDVLFAAAAAARLVDRSIEALTHAATASDAEVSSFAQELLDGRKNRSE